MNMIDLTKAIAPECEIDIIGICPEENSHEAMSVARHIMECNQYSFRVVID